MIFSLAMRNLWLYRSRTLLLLLAVAVGVSVLLILGGLRGGVASYFTSEVDAARLVVRPPAPIPVLSLATQTRATFTPDDIITLGRMEGVKALIPQTVMRRPATLDITLDLKLWSGTLELDTMLFGSSPELFPSEIASQFNNKQGYVPVIVSSRLLSLYNFLVAEQNGLPNFSETDFIGKDFQIYRSYSSFLQLGEKRDPVKARIIAFSPDVEMLGLTIPLEYTTLWQGGESEIGTVVVVAENPLALENIRTMLEARHYRIQDFSDNQRLWEQISWYLNLLLLALGGVVWVAVALILFSIFTALGEERRLELGTLRLLGAHPRQIYQLFASEALALGVVGTFLGFLVGFIAGKGFELALLSLLAGIKLRLDTLFAVSFVDLLFILIFALLICLLAVLWPARRACKREISALLAD